MPLHSLADIGKPPRTIIAQMDVEVQAKKENDRKDEKQYVRAGRSNV